MYTNGERRILLKYLDEIFPKAVIFVGYAALVLDKVGSEIRRRVCNIH